MVKNILFGLIALVSCRDSSVESTVAATKRSECIIAGTWRQSGSSDRIAIRLTNNDSRIVMVNSGEPVASVIYAYRGSDIPGAFIPAGMDWIYPPDIADTRRKWQNFTLLIPKSDKTDGMSIMEFTMSMPDVNLREVSHLEVWIRAFALEPGLSVPPDDFRGLLKDMPVKLGDVL